MTETAIAELEAAVQRVRDLHRRSHAVSSWGDPAVRYGVRYEDPCPECDGKPGVHDCGCWAERQIEFVCAECHRLGGGAPGIYDYTWPCPTMKALEGDTDGRPRASEGVA